MRSATTISEAWQQPVVSSDGLCVAYLENSPDGSSRSTLKVWNLETDQTTNVLTSEDPIEMSGIEAPAPVRLTR